MCAHSAYLNGPPPSARRLYSQSEAAIWIEPDGEVDCYTRLVQLDWERRNTFQPSTAELDADNGKDRALRKVGTFFTQQNKVGLAIPLHAF